MKSLVFQGYNAKSRPLQPQTTRIVKENTATVGLSEEREL